MNSKLTDDAKFDNYIKWLLVIPATIILMGQVQQVIYYYMFRLNIFEFITVSDALIASLQLAIWSGICTIFAYYETRDLKIKPVTDTRTSRPDVENEPANDELKEITTYQQESKFKAITVRYTAMALIFCILIMVGFSLSGDSNWFNSSLLYIVVISLMLVTFLFTQWIDRNPVSNSRFLTRTFKYFVVLNLFLLYRNLTAAIDLKNGDAGRTVKVIQLKDDTALRLDSAFTYVGRVENYTFLFNTITHEKQVIDNSEIKSFIYR